MAAKGVSVLKFVGTVSLGVLTGLSYSLSALTIPALLTLPSADSASRAFNSLTTAATRHLGSLASLSSSAFILAYFLSPRALRHPYLIYASALALGSHLAASDLLAPYLLALGPAGRTPASASSAAAAKKQQQKKKQEQERARARMEASYEVLGSAGSDAHSEGSTGGSASGEETEGGEAGVNGEEVRVEVEVFLKQQIVRSAVAGLGFLLSVVGIWGDGVVPIYSQSVYIDI